MSPNAIPSFGDAYYAELTGEKGSSVQRGTRPVLIAQNNIGNKYSPTVEIIPMSSHIEKAKYMPTHVIIRAADTNGLAEDSVVLAEQCLTIPKSKLARRLGRLLHQDLVEVGNARRIQSPFPTK